MLKKLMISLLVAVVAVTLLVSVAAAQESDSTLEALYEQIHELRRQVVERQIELGVFSAEEGNERLEFMDERFEERRKGGSGWFPGMHGWGWGSGDSTRGYGHCRNY